MKRLAAALLWLAGAGSASASSSGADFLKIPVGARDAAMGGAVTAVSDDLAAVFWNPAGLVERRSAGAQAGHVQWLGGTALEHFSLAASSGENAGGLGVAWFRAPRSDATDPLDPSADRRTASASDLSARLSIARRVRGPILAGAGLHLVHRDLPGAEADVLGAHAGLLWRREDGRLRAGAAFSDWGPSIAVGGHVSGWPTILRLGVAWVPLGEVWADESRLLLSADVHKLRDASAPQLRFGAELSFAGVLALRVGIQHGGAAGPLTAGLGYRAGPVRLDYAFVPYLDLGATHRASVTLHLSVPRRPPPPPPSQPADLRASVSGGRLYLSWAAPPQDPPVYAVYASRGAGLLERVPESPIRGNLYVVSDYDPVETYYFEVAAVGAEGRESERSVPLAFAPQIGIEELFAALELAWPPPEPRDSVVRPPMELPPVPLPPPPPGARPAAPIARARTQRDSAGLRSEPGPPPPARAPQVLPLMLDTPTPHPADRPHRLVAASGSGIVRLEWAPPARNPVGYRIYIAVRRGGPYRPFLQDLLSTNRFEIQGLPPGRAFHFAVTAVWPDGSESGQSEAVGAVP